MHYVLYIDDSGSRFPDTKEVTRRNDGMDCFALGGILVEEQQVDNVKKLYTDFCKKWDISYPLHSTKIRGMRGDFAWLKEDSKKYLSFMGDLKNFLTEAPVMGFAVVINRQGYNDRYKEKYKEKRWWMCKTAYCILIERVTKYVKSNKGTFEIRFEEVGRVEDRAIIGYTKDLKKNGHPFSAETSAKYITLNKEDYQETILGDARRKLKSNLFVQVADLYLYPMIKRRYNPLYAPWLAFFENKKVIDSILSEEDCVHLGIKYSCFDGVIESKNSE